MNVIRIFFPAAWRSQLFVSMIIFLLAQHALADTWPKLILPTEARAVVVADQIDINRQPMRIWQFYSSKTPDQLLAFYREKWAKPPKKQSPPFIERNAAGWLIISRVEEGFLIAIQIDAKSKKESNGYISISQLKGSLVSAARISHVPEYPKMSGSKVLEELNNHDHGKNALTVVMENGNSAISNRTFYKNYYERHGWVEIGSINAQPDNMAVLLLQKGPLETSFTFVSKNARTQVVGAIQYTEN